MKKILIFIFSLFLIIGVTSCGNNDKEQVQQEQINKIVNNKNKDLDKKEEKKENFKLEKFAKDIKKISFSELNNSLYSNGGGNNLKEKIDVLSASGETLDNKLKATFLESFIGDYKNALESRKELCKNNKNSDFCIKKELELTSYRPVDLDGNILNGVNISIDGKNVGKLKAKGKFELENKFIHRIKVSKEGYLDFYKKIYIDSNSSLNESLNPKLLKADLTKNINNNENLVVKTNNFNFNILNNTFESTNGKLYNGKVKIYVFDISEEDGDLNILNLDAFDENGNYLGNSMVTFGMPLIKAYDINGNELKIGKNIIGKGKIQNQEKSPNINLIDVPKNKWLSKEDLDKYNIPSFWYLDQENGIWLTSKIKILDTDGNYEFKLK